MEKQLKLQVVADTTKFEGAVNQLKSQASKLHWELSSVWDNISTSWIDKLDSKLMWAKGTASKLRSTISEKHSLQLTVDDFEQKIKMSRNKLRTLQGDTQDAQKLRLDISDYTIWLNKAKSNLRNFVNTWDQSVNKLQQSFLTLSKTIGSIAAWIAGVEKIKTVEELQQKLVVESWLSASQAKEYSGQLASQAVKAWVRKEDYITSYMSAVKFWWVWPWNVTDPSIIYWAIAEQRGYSSEEYQRAIKSVQKAYWWFEGDIWKQIFWLISSSWIQDVQKDIPNLLAEYAPILKERWFNFGETLNVLVEASKQWTFNLEKPLDLIKEQWKKISDRFTAWSDWDLKLLNQLFWQSFQDLQKQYEQGDISSKDVGQILSEKSKDLSKSNQLKLILDFFWSQSEDLWIQNTLKLLSSPKWLNSNALLKDLSNQADYTTSELRKTSYSLSWGVNATAAWLDYLVWKWSQWIGKLFWQEEWDKPTSIVTNNYYTTEANVKNQIKNSKIIEQTQAK